MLKIERIGRLLAAAVALCLVGLPLFAAPPNGGGGNKVSVTAAYPPDAFQGEELDVIVSGSGFDAGSQVGYLVTGTSDDSQVDVLSVEYVSETELRTRIRPKDNALPTEYDIEVRTSSGRKGKGTTLFRVKQQESQQTCTGLEDTAPSIAFLTDFEPSGEVYTADIYLASESGCDQYLLLADAAQEIPAKTQPYISGGILFDVSDLRLDVEGSLGLVIWRDRAETAGPPELNYLSFAFDGTRVIADPLGPQVLYVPPDDWRPYLADVRIDEAGGFELVMTEKPVGIDTRRLVYVRIDPLGGETREVLLEGDCPILDASGACFRLGPGVFWSQWNADGSEVYFTSTSWLDQDAGAITRIRRTTDGWQPAEVLVANELDIEVEGVRSDGLLSYDYSEWVLHRNGKPSGTRLVGGIIDPDNCAPIACTPADGFQLPDGGAHPDRAGQWTRDGAMLRGEWLGNDVVLEKFANPLSGERARFESVGPVNPNPNTRDTSF